MQIITLNQFEYRIVKFLARERYSLARKGNRKHKIYGIDEIQNEINSFGAEFAFCKSHNCYPDLTPGQLLPFDAMVNGVSFDIKQTNRENGRLLIRWDRGRVITPPDFYVLMIGSCPTYKIAGYIAGRDVIQDTNIARNLPHPAYAIDQGRLSQSFARNDVRHYPVPGD